VLEGASRNGSIILTYAVTLTASYILGMATGAGEQTGKFLFDHFLRDSIEGMLSKKPVPSRPDWLQKQRVLEARDGNQAPILDSDREWEVNWDHLRGKGAGITANSMRPVGRSVGSCEIRIGSLVPIFIGPRQIAIFEETYSEYRERQITHAVHQLNLTSARISQ
jgi:hypothetical protein